jgi:mono/diheme cytochrome c family protein
VWSKYSVPDLLAVIDRHYFQTVYARGEQYENCKRNWIGAYRVGITACGDCHGANLEGRPPEAAEQGPPAGPNITPGSRLSSWTAANFAAAMRQGQAPDGRQLSTEMPWQYYSVMSDDEVQAIWLYLQTIPAQ